MAGAGGGFWEHFLTPSQKEAFAEWHEEQASLDPSVLGRALAPSIARTAAALPDAVAPNVPTLVGLAAVAQAWYFCESYAESRPYAASFVSATAIGAFWLLSALDRELARSLMDTSLGVLFKHTCELIACVFVVVILCASLAERSVDAQWYWVQSAQLLWLLRHYTAFRRADRSQPMHAWSGELSCAAMVLLTLRSVLGFEWVRALKASAWGLLYRHGAAILDIAGEGSIRSAAVCPARVAFLAVFCAVFAAVALDRGGRRCRSRRLLLLILGLRAANAFLRSSIKAVTTKPDILSDGFFMAMVTTDVIVAKMARRELHPGVVFMVALALVPDLHLMLLGFVVFYHFTVFKGLATYLNMPLFQVCRNVYCDGIYDLCHVGHKNAFRNALRFGNRLFVGVVGDADANAYKRPPVMSAAEREAEVAGCKCVTKVIRNAPCWGLTEEFLREHRIHVVAFGQEYLDRYPNPDDDPYYKVPRKLGIARPLPRTEGLSTSDLIRRIQSMDVTDKKSPT